MPQCSNVRVECNFIIVPENTKMFMNVPEYQQRICSRMSM